MFFKMQKCQNFSRIEIVNGHNVFFENLKSLHKLNWKSQNWQFFCLKKFGAWVKKKPEKSFFAQIICHCGIQAKPLIFGHIKAQSYAKNVWIHTVHPCGRKWEASMHHQLPFMRHSLLHNRCQQICNSKSCHKHDFSSIFFAICSVNMVFLTWLMDKNNKLMILGGIHLYTIA